MFRFDSEELYSNGRRYERLIAFYRVNFEVIDLNPFSHPAFSHLLASEKVPKQSSFEGELMAGFAGPPR